MVLFVFLNFCSGVCFCKSGIRPLPSVLNKQTAFKRSCETLDGAVESIQSYIMFKSFDLDFINITPFPPGTRITTYDKSAGEYQSITSANSDTLAIMRTNARKCNFSKIRTTGGIPSFDFQ